MKYSYSVAPHGGEISAVEPDVELRSLCDEYADFSTEEWGADHDWLRSELRSGRVGPVNLETLEGKIVAVYQATVVAVGEDETAMRVHLAKTYDVHPGRFVLHSVDPHALAGKARGGFPVRELVIMLALAVAVAAVVGIAAVSSLGSAADETFGSGCGSSMVKI